MEHRILVYGGLGNVASERIIPSLELLRSQFSIEYAIVDLNDTGPGTYYKYDTEPILKYNTAIIATPNNTHSLIAIKALDSGLNVLCEKPLAHTIDSADQMLAASKAHPRLIAMLSDHYVYKPSVRHIIYNWKKYHQEIGPITNIKAIVFEQELQKGRDWLFSREVAGGGIAMDTGFHIVSIMGKLFEFKNLTVTGAKITRCPQAPGDAETYACITLATHRAPIHIEVGKWMGKVEKEIIFKGQGATLEANIGSGEVLLNGKIDRPPTVDDCYPNLLKELLSSIEQQRTPWTTFEEGYKALQIIKTAYKIAEYNYKACYTSK
jgi:predicted dehydrogenase